MSEKSTRESGGGRAALPMTRAEMDARGWDALDVLLVTGDAYVDHPSFGAAVIGRVLEADGWRVGIVAQLAWTDPDALRVMGPPRLFCGVTAGNLDSMPANYTAARRKRRDDAYSEGGQPGRRPNLATVVYAQLARRAFPGVAVIVGGIEASLRRVAHYDYWQDKVRPSILCDAKADLLVYGMGERAVREIARRLAAGRPLDGLRGTARLLGARAAREYDAADAVLLPSLDECAANPAALRELTRLVEAEQNPFGGRPLLQAHGDRLLRIEPPAEPLSTEEMDRVHEFPYTRRPHPRYQASIPAFETVRDSIVVVRGCCGGCSFCGLGLHQGRFLTSRSEESVAREARALAAAPGFRGTITDLGGPTANLYGCRNGESAACRACRRPGCLFPNPCPNLRLDDGPIRCLMRRVSGLPGVKRLYIRSGIRMDVALRFPAYVRDLTRRHTGGHLKVAPEHLHPDTLHRMRKPGPEVFHRFLELFERESATAGMEQYVTPYFIANFPGSTPEHGAAIERFLAGRRWRPLQTQDFMPLPMTPAAAMYWSGLDYETGEPIPVARGLAERRAQSRQLGRRGRKGQT